MPNPTMAPTQVARHGPATRKQKKSKISKTRNIAESNGVAGVSHPLPARARSGQNLGPTTSSNGTTRPTKIKAGSPRANNPSPRLKSSSAEVATSSTHELTTLEAEIKQNHDQFLVSFRTSIGHARRIGQLLLKAKEKLSHGEFTDWVKSRVPFSVESARAYMRVARNGAIVEEGSKRQFATGLTLTKVLKRLVKPRAKKTASEGGGADTSTSSTRSTSNGQAGADTGGRSAAATAQTTADAAGAEDRPNRSESAKARRDAAHEDGDRRRDENGANGQRAERADRRTRGNKDAESARDDDGATGQDRDVTTVTDEQLDDEQWLAKRKVRQKLADPTAFDSEALLWRHTWPEIELMIRRIEARRPGLLEELADEAFPYCWYARQLAEMTNFPHPDSWKVCSLCKGKGHKGREKKPCLMCAAAGYKYTNWLRTH
jgi:hypothetical protein